MVHSGASTGTNDTVYSKSTLVLYLPSLMPCHKHLLVHAKDAEAQRNTKEVDEIKL